MFTKQQIEEIKRKLQLTSRKDTQFEQASVPINGTEEIAFVQNGKNVRMNMTSLLDNLLLFRASDFINLSDVFNNRLSLKEAIKLISPVNRKTGVVITYIDETTDDWVVYQFKGKYKRDWFDLGKWKSLLDGERFKGFYPNEILLNAVHPYPTIGDYAFVGESFDTSVIYRCINNGIWSRTDENAGEFVRVIFDGQITIGGNGNFYQNGIDTGIKAQGPKGNTGNIGPKGDKGNKGDNGKSPILRVFNNYIQYGYDNINWINMIPLEDLEGPKGKEGDIYIPELTTNYFNV